MVLVPLPEPGEGFRFATAIWAQAPWALAQAFTGFHFCGAVCCSTGDAITSEFRVLQGTLDTALTAPLNSAVVPP